MVFTKCNKNQGKFGSGNIPPDLQGVTSSLAKQFHDIIPDEKKANLTYHLWYDELPIHLKDLVNKVKTHPFWNSICESDTCVFDNMSSMDELYYSRVPSKEVRGLLYGATTNYDLHVDGIMSFPGISFYRVLIGLTNGNDNIETNFPILNESVYINKDQYVVFDFDKAHHQVIKHQNNSDYRILLKLHFCVCEKCMNKSLYLTTVEKIYILYEYVTRYIMKTGTNPTTYYQFFWGLIAYLVNHAPWILYLYVIGVVLAIILRTKILVRIIVDVSIVYLLVVFMFWLRYVIYKVR